MEQDRIHIKLARRTPEERQADETRRSPLSWTA